MEQFSEIADQIGELESRVADLVYDALRSQLHGEDASAAKELERQLSKVRRSLQKAEQLLRAAPTSND